MQITVIENKFGHLHIFKGEVVEKLHNLGSQITLLGRKGIGTQSDIYLQDESDILHFYESLSLENQDTLNNGFPVVVNDIGYF